MSVFVCVCLCLFVFFFFKQKAAYGIRLSLVGSEMCVGDRCDECYVSVYVLCVFVCVFVCIGLNVCHNVAIAFLFSVYLNVTINASSCMIWSGLVLCADQARFSLKTSKLVKHDGVSGLDFVPTQDAASANTHTQRHAHDLLSR